MIAKKVIRIDARWDSHWWDIVQLLIHGLFDE